MATEINVYSAVEDWLTEVVIGLNLCPFAHKPYIQKQIQIVISQASNEESLLQEVFSNLQQLENTPAESLETTLLVIPELLKDFYDYNDFLDLAEAMISQYNWEGIFQIASFHPDYQFAGTQPKDPENLTNQAPYPILHLLREQSIEKAILRYPNPESIPEINIKRVCSLSEQQIKELFPYLNR
jgi:hypothetical protein